MVREGAPGPQLACSWQIGVVITSSQHGMGYWHSHLKTNGDAWEAEKSIRGAWTPLAGPLSPLLPQAPPAQSPESILGEFWSSAHHCQDKSRITETWFCNVHHMVCSEAVPPLWYPWGRECFADGCLQEMELLEPANQTPAVQTTGAAPSYLK